MPYALRSSLALAGLVLGMPLFAQDVAMFRGDLAHTGVYRAAGVPSYSRVKWAFRTSGRVISSPAIAGGTAYVGSTDGNLYAVDVESGQQRWMFPTRVRIASSPAVADGVVYVESYDGNLYAVDAKSGALLWKFATAGERRFTGRQLHGHLPKGETMPDPFDLYLSSPAIWRGIVYFGSGDGNVYAVDARTGRLRWKHRTGNVVHASPAIANGTVYIGSWDSWFYALDALTGQRKWRFKTGEDSVIANQVGMQSSAAVMNGIVYFGCRDGHLYAVDERTGRQRWAFDAQGSWVNTSPAVRDGKVYMATADSRTLYELDAATGAPTVLMKSSWYFFSSPAIAGNMLYIGNWDGKLSAVNLDTKQVAWVFQTDSSRANLSKYTNADGGMAFGKATPERGFYDGLVVALDRIFTMGSFLSSPVVVGNVLYIGSMDGSLYAIE